MPVSDDELDRAIHESVHIEPYDPTWPLRFAQERDRLLSTFPGAFADVQHIGSTAVPGLAAKPIVDLLAAVPSMAAADALLPALCAAGWHTSAAYNGALAARRWLMRQAGGRRTHHLHLVVPGTSEWYDPIAFRDRLRADPAIAAAYVELKRAMADRHRADRDAYTRAKGEFIAGTLRVRPQP